MKRNNKLPAALWLTSFIFGCIIVISVLFFTSGCEARPEYNQASLRNRNNDGTDYTITRDYYDGVTVQGWNGYAVVKDYEVVREDDGSIKITLTLEDMLND